MIEKHSLNFIMNKIHQNYTEESDYVLCLLRRGLRCSVANSVVGDTKIHYTVEMRVKIRHTYRHHTSKKWFIVPQNM